MVTRAARAAGIRAVLTASLLAALASSAVAPGVARAEPKVWETCVGTCGPGWEVTAHTFPTKLLPGKRGTIEIDVFNIGAAGSQGPITVTDKLPSGVTAVEAGDVRNVALPEEPFITHDFWSCEGNGPGNAVEGASVVTCTNTSALPSIAGGGGDPPNHVGLPQPAIGILVNAPEETVTQEEAEATPNHVTVAGGGAPSPASTTDPLPVGAESSSFGFAGLDAWFSNADGTVDTLAGSHPYELTATFDLATALGGEGGESRLRPVAEARNVEVQLPTGFVGDAAAVPRCARADFEAIHCPEDSEIGTVYAKAAEIGNALPFPLYNLVPPRGIPAEFGFSLEGISTYLNSTVRSGGDYGVSTSVDNIAQRVIVSVTTTIWGVPGDPSHDVYHKPQGCSDEELERSQSGCWVLANPSLKPLLTLPTSCTRSGEAAPEISIRATSWDPSVHPAESRVPLHDSNDQPTGITGCQDLAFGPGLSVTPETSSTDSPSGIALDVKPPLGGLEDARGRASSSLKHASGSAPLGFVVNPGQAAGLQACQETVQQSAIGTEEPAHCPPASKVGTVKIRSPLLEAASEKEFEGNVYVLQSNPPQIHLLVAANADGVNLKLVGIAHLNTSTGQVETTFGEDPTVEAEDPFLKEHMALPDLPASSFKLTFEGGTKAALVTPSQCGTYTTNADFTPWASPALPDFFTNAALAITSGPGGDACPSNPLPFAPSMAAGSTNAEAGAFTGFTQLLSRGDGQQRIEKFQFKEPAGMAGMLSQVPLCPEPQASQGACDEASKIGHAIVTAGPGNNPLTLPQPGGPEIPIYLTGPYHGAPFGLSIKTPVIAGPFNLGTIVTRAKIEVDPTTAQITISTDPLPQILDGVPTDLRSIYAVIDRQGFLFNPTNCTPQEFVGTATSAGGAAVAPISSHFGIGACRALTFAPKFSVSTSGKASKAGGASLDVKVAASGGPPSAGGGEANIRSVKVALPKQLPSRLTTLQKACLAAVFEANPASCPKESDVGTATAKTPILANPLTGPAYLVSHGGAAFPDLEIVLQGEGITLVLDGHTDIKKGITYSRFETVPDAPISSFELKLPTGPFSVLGAYVAGSNHYNFCGQSLTLPTTITAQNGAVVTQTTKLGVSGCPPSVSISKTAVKGNSVAVTVKLGQQGTVKITGRGLRTTTKRGLKAGTRVINVPLTAVGRAAKQHGRRLKIQAALTVSGRTGTATTTLRA